MLCAMCICIHMQLSDRHSVDTGRGHRDVKGTHRQMLRHVCTQAQPGCARVETASGGLWGERVMGQGTGRRGDNRNEGHFRVQERPETSQGRWCHGGQQREGLTLWKGCPSL